MTSIQQLLSRSPLTADNFGEILRAAARRGLSPRLTMSEHPEDPSLSIGPVEVPDHLRPHYANFVNVNFTPWDFRLVFALLRAPAPGEERDAAIEAGGVRPQAVSEMIVPANLMHGLIMALQDNFQQYLTQFGVPGMDPEGPRPNHPGEQE